MSKAKPYFSSPPTKKPVIIPKICGMREICETQQKYVICGIRLNRNAEYDTCGICETPQKLRNLQYI